MEPITATVPAKLLLSGEHSVLAGGAAAGLPVPLWLTITLTEKRAAAPALQFDSQSGEHLAAHSAFMVALQQHIQRYRRGRVHINVKSDIPIGSGLGSSAALCVACATALYALRTGRQAHATAFAHRSRAAADIWDTAHRLESHFHGSASGVDTGIIALAAPTLFWHAQQEEAPIQRPARHYRYQTITDIHLALMIIVLPRHATTKQMIAAIGARPADILRGGAGGGGASTGNQHSANHDADSAGYGNGSGAGNQHGGDRREGTTNTLAAFCAESEHVAAWLATPQRQMEAGYEHIRRLYQLQRQLGMSTAEVDAFIDESERCGAMAGKISGGGGGGCAFALFADWSALTQATAALRRFCARHYRSYHLYAAEYNGQDRTKYVIL